MLQKKKTLYGFNDDSGATLIIILKEGQSFDIRVSDHMTCILPVAGIVFLLFCVLAANTPENIFQIYI